MRGAVLYAPGDVRVDDRPDPEIIQPTDAVIRLSATWSSPTKGSSSSPNPGSP